jgi:hypothetical protein
MERFAANVILPSSRHVGVDSSVFNRCLLVIFGTIYGLALHALEADLHTNLKLVLSNVHTKSPSSSTSNKPPLEVESALNCGRPVVIETAPSPQCCGDGSITSSRGPSNQAYQNSAVHANFCARNTKHRNQGSDCGCRRIA